MFVGSRFYLNNGSLHWPVCVGLVGKIKISRQTLLILCILTLGYLYFEGEGVFLDVSGNIGRGGGSCCEHTGRSSSHA